MILRESVMMMLHVLPSIGCSRETLCMGEEGVLADVLSLVNRNLGGFAGLAAFGSLLAMLS